MIDDDDLWAQASESLDADPDVVRRDWMFATLFVLGAVVGGLTLWVWQ